MKKILLFFTLFNLTVNLILSQEQKLNDPSVKSFFDTKKELGGDVIIKNCFLNYKNDSVSKTFIIESQENGEFYISTWLSTVKLPQGNGNLSYRVVVNGHTIQSKLEPQKNDWHSYDFKLGNGERIKVKLISGKNEISFVCPSPETPRVEFVRLSKNSSNTFISSEKYDGFCKKLRVESKNYTFSQDSVGSKLKSIAPLAEYQVREGVATYYTYYSTYYFSQGTQVNISTSTLGYSHVIEMFSQSTPATYSWAVFASSNGTLSVNIPYTGYYYVRLRNWRNGSSTGTAILNVNGNIVNNAPIAGNALALTPNTAAYSFNFFSANLTSGDSRIWLESAEGSIPGKIVAFNDDYMGLGYYDWGVQSRVNGTFSKGIRSILVSSFGTYNPITICDLYGYVYNADASYWSGSPLPFPCLLPDDAMTSAWYSSSYNCIGYSGGLTGYVWPPTDSKYRTPGSTELQAFDNYYATVRYPGAMTYNRSDDPQNGCIGLMGFDANSNFQHAQCKRPANNQTHGFDWESKTGYASWRIFHARESLGPDYFGTQSVYGSIQHFYSPASTLKSMTLANSIDAGLTKLERVEYTVDEKDAFNRIINKIPESIKEDLSLKFKEWEKTWQKPELIVQSNPKMFIQSNEYKDFLNICKTQGSNVIPYLSEILIEKNSLLINELLTDLFTNQYSSKMREICNQNKEYDDNGVFIFHTQYSDIMKFFKGYALNIVSEKKKIYSQNDIKLFKSVVLAPNPVNDNLELQISLNNDSEIILVIYGQYGAVVLESSKYFLQSGNSTIRIDISALHSGMYYLQLRSNHSENFVRPFNKL